MLGQMIVNGILTGALYAVIGLGLSLQAGIMGVINLGYGALLMLSMYTALFGRSLYGIPLLLMIVINILIFSLFCLLMQKYLLSRKGDPAPVTQQLLITLGIGVVLQNIVLMIWGATPRGITIISERIIFGDIFIPVLRFQSLVIVMVIVGMLYLFLQYTWLGKAVRATAQNYEGAIMMGVKVRSIYLLVLAMVGALIGTAGAVLISFYSTYPTVGQDFLLIAFTVTVLGGRGKVLGTIVAGFMVGILGSFTMFYLPSGMEQLIYFTLFIVFLLVRPAGLFGTAETT